MKRIFIYADEKSNKFWSIEVTGNGYVVNYGKTGTAGQMQTKDFADEATCQKAAEKLIAEKTKKGYIEQGEGVEMPIAAGGGTDSKLRIPKYKEHESAELPCFVVDITDPLSIGSILKHHTDDFEEYIELIADGMLDYGTIDDDEFVPLEGESDYSEEIFYNAAVSFPELHPLLEKYAKKALKASKEETASGPWSTEETIVGEFAIPALAMYDCKYVPLLLKYMASNVEIKFSSHFQQTFEFVLARVRAKYDMPAEGEEEEPEDRELKMLKKFLKNQKTDLAYTLATEGKDSYSDNNPNSLFAIQKKFGHNADTTNVFPKLMIAVKEELEKKNGMPLNLIIENAYRILSALSSHIPLKRLNEVIAGIAAGEALPADDSIVNEEHKWDFWELPNPMGGQERSDIQSFSVRFDSKSDLEQILKQFVDRFDQYLLVWRYSFFPDSFAITNLSVPEGSSRGRAHNRESDFFVAVAKFPELAPLVAQYVEKLTEEHRKSALLHAPSTMVRARGGDAAAAMVVMDESTDEKLLEFINATPQKYYESPYGGLYNHIRSSWKEMGCKPNVPQTMAAHPLLNK